MSNVHGVGIELLLLVPLDAEQVAQRIADGAADGRQGDAVKALDVDRSDLQELANDEERHADSRPIGNHENPDGFDAASAMPARSS